MRVEFKNGWPYRYAHVLVADLNTLHAANEIICLWAEDDPAQIEGMTLLGLFARLDGWAASTLTGFSAADRALDSYIAFEGYSTGFAELDLTTLVASRNTGYIGPLNAKTRKNAILTSRDLDDYLLRGSVYYQKSVPKPPRDLAEFRATLSNRQRADLAHGLANRADIGQHQVSGGHDHVALIWDRHDGEHDALFLSFSGTGDTLAVHSHKVSPSDESSRLRRAGPDAPTLRSKRVLIAGLGAVGGHAAITLAKSGLGFLDLRDDCRRHVKTDPGAASEL